MGYQVKKKKKKKFFSKQEKVLIDSISGDNGGGNGDGGDVERVKKKEQDVVNGYMTDSSYYSDKEKLEDRVILKKKRIFRAKDSILTELSRDDKNFKSLYHAFIIMIITGIAYSLLKDTVEAGKPYVDVRYYDHGFGPAAGQLTAFIVWIPLQVTSFLVYPVFKIWSAVHSRLGLPADISFLLLFITYNIAGHALVVTSIVNFDLPPVPALVLSIEELRFTMKSISFVRENAYKVLYPWHKDDQSGPAVWYAGQMSPQVGSFTQYVYFLFAPTLLYRDHYPRIPQVRYLRVIAHLIKCIISVTFISIVTKEIFTGTYDGSGKKFAETFLSCMLWGLILHFMSGYFFLHSWHNLFGEMLRFADREFYSDWWTCSTFSQYYRKWNLLVHDWIKAYIYQDLKDLFHSKLYNRVAVVPTILISAIYHEYVFWAPMRYVMPILLIQFGFFGALLFFLQPSSDNYGWNYFLHFSLHVGVSIMVFCYTMEFFARKVCPKEENLVNTFIPRFYECFVS